MIFRHDLTAHRLGAISFSVICAILKLRWLLGNTRRLITCAGNDRHLPRRFVRGEPIGPRSSLFRTQVREITFGLAEIHGLRRSYSLCFGSECLKRLKYDVG